MSVASAVCAYVCVCMASVLVLCSCVCVCMVIVCSPTTEKKDPATAKKNVGIRKKALKKSKGAQNTRTKR